MTDPSAPSGQDAAYNPEEWDTIYQGGYICNYPVEHIVAFVFRNFGKAPDRGQVRILDIGCGGGNNLWMLAREGFTAHGLDGSAGALSLAGEKLQKEGLRAELQQGTFQDLPYDSGFFDAVVDDAAVQANPIGDVALIFKQIQRVLKPGGWYHGWLLGSDSKSSMQGEEVEPGTFLSTGGAFVSRNRLVHFFNREEIEQVLQGADFTNITANYCTTSIADSSDSMQFWLVEAQKPQ